MTPIRIYRRNKNHNVSLSELTSKLVKITDTSGGGCNHLQMMVSKTGVADVCKGNVYDVTSTYITTWYMVLPKARLRLPVKIGFETSMQVKGVSSEPLNPISVALALKAGFVSRVNIGNYAHAKRVLKEAFLHKGYALVDIFQPCVVFNKVNTYKWFRDNTYELESSYEKNNLPSAMGKALEIDPIPIGIFYQSERTTFEESIRGDEINALFNLTHDIKKLQKLFEMY